MEKTEGGSLYKNQGEIYRASLNVNHTLWIVTIHFFTNSSKLVIGLTL